MKRAGARLAGTLVAALCITVLTGFALFDRGTAAAPKQACFACYEWYDATYGMWFHAFSGDPDLGPPYECGGEGCHGDPQGGACSQSHLDCASAAVAVAQEVRAAAPAAGGDELKRLLARHAGSLRYNAGRAALQVVGCDEAIVAHIPLERRQVAALAE
jgi:hypothetical protein